jgi:hypothetical protein
VDPVIEPKIVEDNFSKAERRRMVRARKIDATRYTNFGAGYVRTSDLLTDTAGARAPEAGVSAKDIASMLGPVITGVGSIGPRVHFGEPYCHGTMSAGRESLRTFHLGGRTFHVDAYVTEPRARRVARPRPAC